MEILTDIKVWIFALNIVILGFNYFSHQKIVYNDLTHLSADLKELKKGQDNIQENVKVIEQKVSYLEGKTDTQDRTTKILEKLIK